MALNDEMVNSAVERLKASRDAGNIAASQTGKEYGRHWAAEVADCRELERFASRCEDGIEEVAESLYECVRGFCPCNTCDDCTREFWEELFGDDAADAVDDPWMQVGFVAGAMEVWDAVKSKI